MICSMAEMDFWGSFAMTFGGGVSTFLPKSDQRSILERGSVNALVACKAASRPPDIYAAPIIASVTSAIAYAFHINNRSVYTCTCN